MTTQNQSEIANALNHHFASVGPLNLQIAYHYPPGTLGITKGIQITPIHSFLTLSFLRKLKWKF